MVLLLGATLLLAAACTPRMPPPPEPGPLLSEQAPFGPTMTLAEMLAQRLRIQYPPPKIDFPVPKRLDATGAALPRKSSAGSAYGEPVAFSGAFSGESTGGHYIELSQEPVTLHLVSEATAYVLGPSRPPDRKPSPNGRRMAGIPEAGLAVGHATGDIRIWSSWPCASLTLPAAKPVTLLTWDGDGPFLGAGHAQSGELHIFDLRHCARVASVSWQRPIRGAVLSPSLTWAALTDTGQRLFVGPVAEPFFDPPFPGDLPAGKQHELRHVGTLRFPPLALAFSPREGLLQSVDRAGWLLLWTLPDLHLLKQILIPGGPFDAALFHDGHLILQPADDRQERQRTVHHDSAGLAPEASRRDPVIWDIPGSGFVAVEDVRPAQQVTPPAQANPLELLHFFGQFELESGLLTFRTTQDHWLRKLHFGPLRLRVHAAVDARLLRVTEPDQTRRWYDATTGQLAPTPAPEPQDLIPLAVAPDATVRWEGRHYALADPVLTTDGHVLLARHVPKQRFFLWWTQQNGETILKESGRLPLRDNLLPERPPVWMSLSDHSEPAGDN